MPTRSFYSILSQLQYYSIWIFTSRFVVWQYDMSSWPIYVALLNWYPSYFVVSQKTPSFQSLVREMYFISVFHIIVLKKKYIFFKSRLILRTTNGQNGELSMCSRRLSTWTTHRHNTLFNFLHDIMNPYLMTKDDSHVSTPCLTRFVYVLMMTSQSITQCITRPVRQVKSDIELSRY